LGNNTDMLFHSIRRELVARELAKRQAAKEAQ
jgi:hypothetical protein